MDNGLVSIIIPTYNRANLLAETLQSIVAQTYKNWECLIVDDGSTDNTAKLVQKFAAEDSRFHYFQRPVTKVKGGNSCRNYGFEKSKGNYINWFDSDDLMHADFIRRKVEAINSHYDAVISKLAFFENGDPKQFRAEKRPHFSANLLEDFLTLKVTWYLPDVMWRRDFLKDKELFDEHLLAGQDRDFHSRMLLENPFIIHIDDQLTYYRMHDSNLTKNISTEQMVNIKVSHLNSIAKLMMALSHADLLTETIRLHYFRAMIMYYPFVRKRRDDKRKLFELLRFLSFKNGTIYLSYIKLFAAQISFRITGRGSFLLG